MTFAKENAIHLKTSRLILRQWKADDYSPFAKMNSDPDINNPSDLCEHVLYKITRTIG